MMDELMKDVERVHDGIQHLQVQPTKTNIAIIFDALNVLENVYQHLSQENQKEEKEGGE